MMMQESENHRVYTTKEAKLILDGFHKKRPSVKRMMNEIGQEIEQNGFVEDLYGKRYHGEPEYSYRGLNYLIQGTAAQVIKRAMLRLDAFIRTADWPIRMTNVVHDEVQFEIDKDFLDNNMLVVVESIRDVMEDHDNFKLPLTVDFSYSATSWADKEKIV